MSGALKEELLRGLLAHLEEAERASERFKHSSEMAFHFKNVYESEGGELPPDVDFRLSLLLPKRHRSKR